MQKILFFLSLCSSLVILQAMEKQEEKHLEECFIKQKIALEQLKQENKTLKYELRQQKLEYIKLNISLLDTQINAATIRRNNITRRIHALNNTIGSLAHPINE